MQTKFVLLNSIRFIELQKLRNRYVE